MPDPYPHRGNSDGPAVLGVTLRDPDHSPCVVGIGKVGDIFRGGTGSEGGEEAVSFFTQEGRILGAQAWGVGKGVTERRVFSDEGCWENSTSPRAGIL